MKRNEVTIIIPHLGGTRESEYAFDQCIISLTETEPEIKRITVRNGNKCKEHDSHIKLLWQGQCKAVNAAVATVNTPWVFVTNDDMIYPPDWFAKLVNELSDEVMCVSPKLIEPGPGAPTFETYFCGGAGGDFDKQKWLDFSKSYSGYGYRTGFNLPFLIKKELWDLIGGYDINYDPWGSNGDSDLEYKIKLAGVQPFQNTYSIVYHFSQSSGTFLAENKSYWHKNFAYFEQKWGFPRTDVRIWEADFIIPDRNRIYRPKWEGYYAKY